MANLSDILRQPEPTQQAPIGGQSEGIANILKTKLTGQAQPSSSTGPKRSQIGEQQVAQQAQAQSQQMTAQSQVNQQQQRQQAQEQEQAQKIQLQQLEQNMNEKRQSASQQAQEILNSNLQGMKKLKTQEDVANFEQAAFMTRLSSQSYIQNLTKAAAKARIDDEETFKEQYYTQLYKDDMDDFQDIMDFNSIMNANDRDFSRQVSKMSLETARKIADRATEQANSQALFQGIGGLVSGSLQAYSAYDNKQTQDKIAQEQDRRDRLSHPEWFTE